MRRRITIAIIIIVCFLLQGTLFKALSIASIAPNLLVVVTASFGFMRGKKEGLWVGFFCGLLIDLFYGQYLGLYAILYMYVGYLNGFFHSMFFPEDIKLPLILISCSDFSFNVVIYFLMFFLRGNFHFGYFVLHLMIPELLYTILVTLVLYFVILRINQKLEIIEKRSAAKFV